MSVRVRVAVGAAALPLVGFASRESAAWIDTTKNVLNVGGVAGEKMWRPEFGEQVPAQEEYLVTVIIENGHYVVYLDGVEKHRMKTTNTRIMVLGLENSVGAATFDQLRLRRKE